MCINIKFPSAFPDFNSLYSQIDFSNIRLPEFKIPSFTLPNPLFPTLNIPSLSFNFFITDIQNFNLMGILKKFLGKMLGFLGMGFNFLPKMPVLNISFPDLLAYISGKTNALYQLAYSKAAALLAYFPKMYSGFNIPELEVVNTMRMLIGNYLTTITNFASNIVNMVLNKVRKVFKVKLPVFAFPVIPSVQAIIQLAKTAISNLVSKVSGALLIPSIPDIPNIPSIDQLGQKIEKKVDGVVEKLSAARMPTFSFDFSSLPSEILTKILALDFLKAVLKIPGFKFPAFPDISTFFSKLHMPEINLMEKITKIATELPTFLIKKATDFFNKIIGKFLGALMFAIPVFTIPCPPNFIK